MPKQRLLHIGYPKCMSTFLQRNYFSQHPEIFFLGSNLPESEHGWISDEMASLGEVGLRYAKEFVYDPEAAKECLKKQIDVFEADDTKKLLCFSSESMAFAMFGDIDVVQKAKRLRDLFGADSKVLLVIRNQLDLLRSYYYECVRSGLPTFFANFIEYNYYHQFNSIVSDLLYDRIYDLYAQSFGEDNVIVLPMELLQEDAAKGLADLSEALCLNPMEVDLEPVNNSADKKYLQAVRMLNEKFPNNMGMPMFSMRNTAKLVSYWGVELGLEPPPSAKKSFGQKMMIYRAAREVMRDFVDPLDTQYPPKIEEKLKQYYADSNTRFQQVSGLNIKELGYS